MRAVPHLCEFYLGICLTNEEKARKNLSQGEKNLSQVKKNLIQVKKNLSQVKKNLSQSRKPQSTKYASGSWDPGKRAGEERIKSLKLEAAWIFVLKSNCDNLTSIILKSDL